MPGISGEVNDPLGSVGANEDVEGNEEEEEDRMMTRMPWMKMSTSLESSTKEER